MLRIFLFILGAIGVLAIAAAALVSQPSFGRLPRGERRQRIERSPNFRDGAFRNRQPTPLMTSGKGRIRTMLGFLFGRRPANLRPASPVPTVKTDLTALDTNRELLVWFGHSSYLIQTGGRRLLVDPVFVAASPFGFVNKPFPGTAIYRPEEMPPVDYLLITHDHWDHLDYGTVRRLRDRVGKVICPLGVGEHFERWGYPAERLIELDWDEQADLGGGFAVRCLTRATFRAAGYAPTRRCGVRSCWTPPCSASTSRETAATGHTSHRSAAVFRTSTWPCSKTDSTTTTGVTSTRCPAFWSARRPSWERKPSSRCTTPNTPWPGIRGTSRWKTSVG